MSSGSILARISLIVNVGDVRAARYGLRVTPHDTRPGFFQSYLGKGTTASLEDARRSLMSKPVGEAYADPGQFQAALLEQYKIYVEMADRISARRSATNTFFLTLNTAVFTLIGTFWQGKPTGPTWLLVFPVVALVVQCLAWFWLLRSYRQLNSGKYAVIGALEERLPASPYWRAEWQVLGEGKDKARYWPLTHLEQWVPLLFGATYVAAFVAVLLTA